VQLDGRLRFDNYVVGSANRLAVAAAHAVADSPGNVYNPLFIYSGSGLGKTHLLAAIGVQARHIQPDLQVELLSLEEFVEQLHAAIAAGGMDAFKRRYQNVDMLLLDDVQFLTGRRETQAEMLRLFNVLQGGGKQIVMASDRPPNEITDVDERLVSRLAGGLIVDIGAPDFETRVAILRRKCAEREIEFLPEVLDELGKLDFTNVRELQGALNRLIAEQHVRGQPLTADAVQKVITDRGAKGPRRSSRPTKAEELQAALAAESPAAGDVVAAAATPARPSGAEFHSFLSDIAQAVAAHVEPWKVRLGEAVAYWNGEGYRTAVLEMACSRRIPPPSSTSVSSRPR
jgi:chromosomal replication initiator protein